MFLRFGGFESKVWGLGLIGLNPDDASIRLDILTAWLDRRKDISHAHSQFVNPAM